MLEEEAIGILDYYSRLGVRTAAAFICFQRTLDLVLERAFGGNGLSLNSLVDLLSLA